MAWIIGWTIAFIICLSIDSAITSRRIKNAPTTKEALDIINSGLDRVAIHMPIYILGILLIFIVYIIKGSV